MGMARAMILSTSRVPAASRAGVYGGSYFLTTMARCMEESAAAQDSHIRLAPSPETPKDEGISARCDTGHPGRLRIMCW